MAWPRKKKTDKAQSAVESNPITKGHPIYPVLASETCRCGESKRAGTPLGGKCYFSLPKGHQRDFFAFKDNADAYQQAYEQACLILDFIAAHPPVAEQVPGVEVADAQ